MMDTKLRQSRLDQLQAVRSGIVGWWGWSAVIGLAVLFIMVLRKV